jgi:hypothetical protein
MKTPTLRLLTFTAVLLLGTISVAVHSLAIVQAKQTSGAQQSAPSSPPSRPPTGSAQALLDQGQELLSTRQYDEAVEVNLPHLVDTSISLFVEPHAVNFNCAS